MLDNSARAMHNNSNPTFPEAKQTKPYEKSTSEKALESDTLSTSERALLNILSKSPSRNTIEVQTQSAISDAEINDASDNISSTLDITSEPSEHDEDATSKDLSVPVDIEPPPSVIVTKVIKPQKVLREIRPKLSPSKEHTDEKTEPDPVEDFQPPPSVQVG